MNPEALEKLFREADNVKLDKEKKDAIHQELLKFIEKHPVQPKRKSWRNWYSSYFGNITGLKTPTFALSGILLFLLIGGVITVDAQFGFIQNSIAEGVAAVKTVAKNTSVIVSSPALSYNSAVKKYQDRRIQFSVNPMTQYCSVTPPNSVFKKGIAIMLDNRNDKQIAVKLDGRSYFIKPYGFKVITLTTSATLPHTIKIDCHGGKNNASILLQP